MITYSYLRVSTIDQDTEKNKADILKFANYQELGTVRFIEEKISGTKNWREREIGRLIETLVNGDVLITPELSRLGRDMLQILEIVKTLTEKGVIFYSLKENFTNQKDDVSSIALIGIFSTLAQVERKLISQRTKEALQARKAAGIKLGRPVGSYGSKLDTHKDELHRMLTLGVKQKRLAEKYKVTPQLLSAWIKRNPPIPQ